MSDYETFAHRWFDQVWNRQKEDLIDSMVCSDVVGHGLVDGAGREVCGRDQFKAFYHELRSAFPDIHVAVEQTVSEGDHVVALCRVTATHAGTVLGVAPTNRTVEFTGMCWMRLRDGKLAEAWDQFDFLSLYQQIGAVRLTNPPASA